MSRIKAVIFDWGRVLYNFDNNIFLKAIAQHTSKSAEELEQLLYPKINSITENYETGKLLTDEFCQRAIELCDLDMSPNEFKIAYTKDKCWPIEQPLGLLPILHNNGYKLGLLSNTSELDIDFWLRRTPGFELFDAITFSCRVGWKKSSLRPFYHQLSQLAAYEIAPRECAFIDDIETYVNNAEKIGMHGIHCKLGSGWSEEEACRHVVKDMKNLGVRITA